jgi:hypothetical protein
VEPDHERDGLVVVEHERGERRPRAKLVAAAHAPGCVDRVAEVAQPFDVAA